MKENRKLYVLIACEESQTVMKAFGELNIPGVKIEAYSCDLLECSGGEPERHFQQDVFDIIENKGGTPQIGEEEVKVPQWDFMIAHPPCTYLAVSGARWFYHPDDKDKPVDQRRPHPNFPERKKQQKEAVKFVKRLLNAKIEHIVVENPVGVLSSKIRKPDCIVQPFYFGDEARKTTCFWFKKGSKLKKLERTHYDVEEGERVYFKSGKSQPKWYSDALSKAKTAEERRTLRSKTFPGMAKQMAEQWTKQILELKRFKA